MNRRLLSVFLFALAVSGAASFLIYRTIVGHLTTNAPVTSIDVVVAAHDMETGALIQAGDLRTVPWNGPLPAGAFAKASDVVGRGVITRIFQDEPVVSGRVAPQGAGAGLAATIPLGMRAVALRVNDVVGLAGFVLPGMRVDVVVAGNAPGAEQSRFGTVSRTVLQNLEVLSANQRIERNAAGKPEDAQVVNLLVTPDQAEIMNLASSEAKVQLVLRNPLDQKQTPTHGSSTAGLFGGSPVPALARTPDGPSPVPTPIRRQPRLTAAVDIPRPVSVEVFSGSKRTEQRFDSNPEAQ